MGFLSAPKINGGAPPPPPPNPPTIAGGAVQESAAQTAARAAAAEGQGFGDTLKTGAQGASEPNLATKTALGG